MEQLRNLVNGLIALAHGVQPEHSIIPIVLLLAVGLISAFLGWVQLSLIIYNTRKEQAVFDTARIDQSLSGSNTLLAHLVRSYRAAVLGQSGMPDTEAMVAVKIAPIAVFWERLARWMSSSSVGVGLLGTFLGLVDAISNISARLVNLGTTERSMAVEGITNTEAFLSTISAALEEPLKGMSVAFISSVAGLMVSFVMSFILMLIDFPGRRSRFADQLEDFLNNRLFPAIHKDPLQMMISELGERIGTNFDRSLANLSQEMLEMSARIVTTLEGLDGLVSQLGEASNTFDAGSTRLLEFNRRLEESLAHIDMSTDRVTTASEHLAAGVEEFEKQVEAIRHLEAHQLAQMQQFLETSAEKMKDTWREGLLELKAVVEMNQAVSRSLTSQVEHWETLQTGLTDTLARAREAVTVLPQVVKEQTDEALEAGSKKAAEVLATFESSLKDRMAQVEESRRQFLDRLSQDIARLLGASEKTLDTLISHQNELIRSQSCLLEPWKSAGESLLTLSTALESSIAAMTEGSAELSRQVHETSTSINQALDALHKSQKSLAYDLTETHRGARLLGEAVGNLQAAVTGLSEEFSIQAARHFSRALDNFARKLDLIDQLHEAYQAGVEELKAAYAQDARMALEVHFEDLHQLRQALDAVHGGLQNLTRQVELTAQLFSSAVGSLSQAGACAEGDRNRLGKGPEEHQTEKL